MTMQHGVSWRVGLCDGDILTELPQTPMISGCMWYVYTYLVIGCFLVISPLKLFQSV